MRSAVRRGEHACSRLTSSDDRARTAAAFVIDAIDRGDQVFYVCGRDGPEKLFAGMSRPDQSVVQRALLKHQLGLPDGSDFAASRGGFDAEGTLGDVLRMRDSAEAHGFLGLSLTGDRLPDAVVRHDGGRAYVDFERGLTGLVESGERLTFLCQYDMDQLPAGQQSDLVNAHTVDISPEFTAVGRGGRLSAAWADGGQTLRFAGALDGLMAIEVAALVQSRPRWIDLSGVAYIDKPGLSAVRGELDDTLLIAGASDEVVEMAQRLGWDSDPLVTIV